MVLFFFSNRCPLISLDQAYTPAKTRPASPDQPRFNGLSMEHGFLYQPASYKTPSPSHISVYFLLVATGGGDNGPPGLYSWH